MKEAEDVKKMEREEDHDEQQRDFLVEVGNVVQIFLVFRNKIGMHELHEFVGFCKTAASG